MLIVYCLPPYITTVINDNGLRYSQLLPDRQKSCCYWLRYDVLYAWFLPKNHARRHSKRRWPYDREQSILDLT